jgi:plasmid stability protein
MATLTLKNVPDTLVARLKAEARENRRSLNQETLLRLERSIDHRQPDNPSETLAALRRLHEKMAHLPPVDEEFINRAKRQGRA